MHEPGYLNLLSNGELENRVNLLKKMLANCELCSHRCGVNRRNGERGYCKTLDNVVTAGAESHFGEEEELVGRFGSGTIFFSYCNLKCVFCQNYEISYCGAGKEINVKQLAEMMIGLQNNKCHNINLVTPSHVVPQIVEAVFIAAQNGLNIPIVYNSNGYDLTDTLKLLEGIVDIYLPDIKFSDDTVAEKYLGVKNYYTIAKAAIKEMYRQVGNLKTDSENIAYKGVMIRHLVLPENLAGTEKIMKFIAEEISENVYVNIMKQYYPEYKAYEFKEINRMITSQEFKYAINAAKSTGLNRINNF